MKKVISLLSVVFFLTACSPKIGSEEWCLDMKEKAKGDWTATEAGQAADPRDRRDTEQARTQSGRLVSPSRERDGSRFLPPTCGRTVSPHEGGKDCSDPAP